MRLNRFLLGFCIAISQICNAQEVKNVITEGVRFCESTYPLNGKEILIANFGSTVLNSLNTEGKGYILSYSKDTLTTFIPANGHLSAPKGMYAKDNLLFICDVNKVVVYDLNKLDSPKHIIRFPETEMMLNGIIGNDSHIYVSVTNTGNIYRFNIPMSFGVFSNEPEFYTHISGANGLAINGKSLYIASYPIDEICRNENKIYKIADIDNPIAEMLNIKSGKYDGLVFSADNSILYASNWEPLEIVSINLISGEINSLYIDKQIGMKGLAAISILNDTMYIPDLPNSKVIEIQLKEK
jgi:hypothetical protein